MSTKFSFKRQSFIDSVLEPVGRIQDSFTLILKNNTFKVLCSSPSFKLRIVGPIDYDSENEVKLNFADIKKFTRALKFIKDDKPIFEFDNDKISYKSSDGVKFIYHLIDPFSAKKVDVNEERLAALKYEIEFLLEASTIKQIMAAASISNIEQKKIYFYTNEGKVFAEINDKSQSKVDSVSLPVSDVYTGTSLQHTSIDYDIIRNLNGDDIVVRASKQFINLERRDEYAFNLVTTCFTK
jgi:hypothetical protein